MDETLGSISFSEVLESLQETGKPFPVRYLRSFSDLSRKHLKDLLQIWENLPLDRKVNLLEDLEDIIESDTLVNFDNLSRVLISDPNPSIRVLALNLLWECEDPGLIPELLNLSRDDQDEDVRATSTSLLGKYVLLGELEAIKPEINAKVVGHLINILAGNDQARVKQRALESLGYSSHHSVPGLIQNAYLSPQTEWITCALCAMGRSADEAWSAQVDKMLTSPIPEIQFEAIRTAGELELSNSRDKLLNLLEAGIDDEEIRLATIWSLSQIGGDDIKDKLVELLETAADDEEAEWIEKALENLELTSPGSMGNIRYERESEDDPDVDDEEYIDDDEYYDFDNDDDDYDDEDEIED